MLGLDRGAMCDWNNPYRQRGPRDGGLRKNGQVIESVI